MVYLNEWLPNPVGNDAKGEFVELYNNGSAPANLNGWFLKTETGKKFSLTGRRIGAGGYLLLKRSETKLSLRNMDGGLALYGANGEIVDHANFLGTAIEGKSFSRVDHGAGNVQHFAFVDVTPGMINKKIKNVIAARQYPLNTPLNLQLESSGFLGIMMGTSLLLVGLIIYVIKTNEDLSNLFFGSNKEVW